METVTEQPIKKFEVFRCPQSLPGVAPLTKKPEDSGYEIAGILEFYCCRISAVKQCKPLRGSQKKNKFFSNSLESLLATNRWPKSLRTLGTRLCSCLLSIVQLKERLQARELAVESSCGQFQKRLLVIVSGDLTQE